VNIECVGGLCAEGGDGMICTAVCEGAGAIECPAGTTCQMAPGGGLDKCLPAEGGGCGCRAGRGGAGAGLGLGAALLALALAGMRRTRRAR
jgi:MYXO-CTERM domain-containing protein